MLIIFFTLFFSGWRTGMPVGVGEGRLVRDEWTDRLQMPAGLPGSVAPAVIYGFCTQQSSNLHGIRLVTAVRKRYTHIHRDGLKAVLSRLRQRSRQRGRCRGEAE